MASKAWRDAGIEVAAGPGAVVETFCDEAAGCCAYLWGAAAHPDVPKRNVMRWILDTVNSADVSALRQLVGMFIVLIDDRRARKIRIVSDLMGLRPWYVGTHNGRLVCGSDLWAIHDAGFIAGGVNYDAVASWLRHGYDNTSQGLFSDYRKIGRGVVGTWEDGAYSEIPYATYTGAQEKPPRAELLETIHHHMSRSFDALTRDLDHVAIGLSGGYDSRYLAALASKRKHLKVDAVTICDREAEGVAAAMVAEGLHLPLQILRTDGSNWNMYPEPYHFAHDGFPITKQTSWLVARRHPGIPCLNGFIGDAIIRDMLDRFHNKTEEEFGDELVPAYQKRQRLNHEDARFDLLDQRIISNCDERTLAHHQRNFQSWRCTGHQLFGVGHSIKQRNLFSNNFLQHFDIAEGIVPFVNFELIQYRLQNHWSCFSYDTYAELFHTFYPEIGHVPHNTKMGARNDFKARPSHCTGKWAAAVLMSLSRSHRLPLLDRRKAIPRLIGAIAGHKNMEVVAMFLYRLLLLEERLRRGGIDFDWARI